MYKLLYVFKKDLKEKLLDSGFILLKSDEKNSVYIFQAKDNLDYATFSAEDYMFSDSLTF